MARLASRLLVGLLLGACSAGVDTAPGPKEHVERLVGDERVVAGAPGAILGVSVDGAKPWSAIVADGNLDLESAEPIGPDDAFYLGSISKMFTAVVVLQLAQEGALQLDAPLGRYLEDFPRGETVAVRQLLQHTSGLRDFLLWVYFRPDRDEMIDLVTRDWTQEEMLEAAGRFEPSFEAGTDWDYSNTNYVLLGVIVERVTGRTLAQEIRQRILEPLALEETWLNSYEPPTAELRATGHLGPVPGWAHSEMFGDLGPTTSIDRGNLEWAAGGIASTAEESLRFLRGLREGALGDETYRLMQEFTPTPALGAPGAETPADLESYYGLGVAKLVRQGYQLIGHGGLYNGHSTGLWYIPECEADIVLYANRGFIDMRRWYDALVESLGCALGD